MSIKRVKRKKGYFVVMSNYHLKDNTLSLKSKGLLSTVLSLPDDWDYSISGLCSILKENRSAIETSLKELKERGYLQVNKRADKATGRFEYEYIFYEKPFLKKPGVEKPGLESPGMEKPGLDNPPLENPEEYNIKEIKLSKDNKLKNKSLKKKAKFDCLEYLRNHIEDNYTEDEISDIVENKLIDFFKVLKENKVLITKEKIEGTCRCLGAYEEETQLQAIETALEKGWKNIDPAWLKSYKKGTYHNQTKTSSKKKMEKLPEDYQVF